MNIKLWRKNFFFNFFCKKLKSVYQRQQPSRSRYLFYPRSLTIHYHLLLSSIMESLAESSCRGLTKTGTQCARQVNLSENGYCYQHVDQDNDPEVPASFAQPPAGADPHSVGPAVPEPFTIPAAFNPVLLPPSPFRHSEGNSNNDDDSQQQSVDDTDQKGRCHAISNSTRTRCKKMVSVVGQRFCPSHGGTQIRAKIILAMCSAISKTTRQPCKNHVAVMGQKFCNHHGGLAKTSSIVEQQPNIAYPMTQSDYAVSSVSEHRLCNYDHDCSSHRPFHCCLVCDSGLLRHLLAGRSSVASVRLHSQRALQGNGLDQVDPAACEIGPVFSWTVHLERLCQGFGCVRAHCCQQASFCRLVPCGRDVWKQHFLLASALQAHSRRAKKESRWSRTGRRKRSRRTI
jgi:hypothetical protein